MTPFLKTLASRPVPWLDLNGPQTEVVISSRIRLARNIAGKIYPDRFDDSDGLEILESIFEATQKLPEYENFYNFELNTLNEIEKDLLLERRLITHNSVFNVTAGVVVDEEEYFSILVNDEDHMHLQVLRPGFEFDKSWQFLSQIDVALGGHLKYDFSNDYGFLTASPGNVGTALKASVFIDLSALYLSGQIGSIVQASRVLGFRLQGADGQDDSSRPGRYILSTTQSLGLKEEEILSSFQSFVKDVVDCEFRARAKLMADDAHRPLNLVSRAYGALKYSWLLDEDEAFDHLMTLRFGLFLGMFEDLSFDQLERALAYSGNAHLQESEYDSLNNEQLNKSRALLVRRYIGIEN